MTLYNIYLSRIIKLSFYGIEAGSPGSAANLARDGLNSDADDMDDGGEDVSALIEVAAGDDAGQLVTIDFEADRVRTAAYGLLAALERVIAYAENEAHGLDDLKDGPEAEAEAARAWKSIEIAHAAVAAATAAGITPPALATSGSGTAEAEAIVPVPSEIDIHALLAERRQIAAIWSIPDVQAVRPDLSDEQAWDVLRRAERCFNAEIGINWDVLACHADDIADAAPDGSET